jgi:hypothetical protein
MKNETALPKKSVIFSLKYKTDVSCWLKSNLVVFNHLQFLPPSILRWKWTNLWSSCTEFGGFSFYPATVYGISKPHSNIMAKWLNVAGWGFENSFHADSFCCSTQPSYQFNAQWRLKCGVLTLKPRTPSTVRTHSAMGQLSCG